MCLTEILNLKRYSHHNRLTKDKTPCQLNALHQVTSQENSLYTYDPNGNLTSEEKEGKKTAYFYDALDRLIRLETAHKIYLFDYDFWDRLLTQKTLTFQNGKWVETDRQHYLYEGKKELGAWPKELRILGEGRGAEIGSMLAIEKEGKLFLPLHDLFGNLIALINPSGQVEASYRYNSFGEEKASSLKIPWRYQSKRDFDPLIYFGKRFYHKQLGRWITPDPKGFQEGDALI